MDLSIVDQVSNRHQEVLEILDRVGRFDHLEESVLGVDHEEESGKE